MPLKIPSLHSCVKKITEPNLGTESNDVGERFHQAAARFEHCYSGKNLHALLGDICLSLQENDDNIEQSVNENKKLHKDKC